ncbi:MAG: hypothetical protein QOJ59_220, partial [Thermomicrobiales bacterium]|nr:hypothetical protein [Thermomicrobiales bacterium]
MRWIVSFFSVVIALAITSLFLNSSAAQDDPSATVAAIRTQMAVLQTEVASLPTQATASATITPSAEEAFIGDPVRLDPFEFSVQGSIFETELPDSSGYLTYSSNNGHFLVITLSIRNVGAESVEFPWTDFVVEEQYGAQYETNTLSYPIYFGDEYNTSDMIIPNNTYTLKTLFDLPLQAQGLIYRHKSIPIVIHLDERTSGSTTEWPTERPASSADPDLSGTVSAQSTKIAQIIVTATTETTLRLGQVQAAEATAAAALATLTAMPSSAASSDSAIATSQAEIGQLAATATKLATVNARAALTATALTDQAQTGGIDPGSTAEISIDVDATGILDGDEDARQEAADQIRAELAKFPGCTVGFAQTFGYSTQIAEGVAIARAVNQVLKEEFPAVFENAVVDDFANV